MLHQTVQTIVPPISALCEIFGILIVLITVVTSFISYVKEQFWRIPCNAKFQLANGLVTSLSFKMAAELLKTVIVTDFSELLMLGTIIVLRAMMTAMLHYEMKHNAPLEAAAYRRGSADGCAVQPNGSSK